MLNLYSQERKLSSIHMNIITFHFSHTHLPLFMYTLLVLGLTPFRLREIQDAGNIA